MERWEYKTIKLRPTQEFLGVKFEPKVLEVLQLTPYSRFGPYGPRSARGISEKQIQADTSFHLTASRPPVGLKVEGL
ncbi:hypothetical protein GCM10020370_63450 [Paenibacillus hodogayensis]